MIVAKFTPSGPPEEIQPAAAVLARQTAIMREARNWESARMWHAALDALVGHQNSGALIRTAWVRLIENTIERRQPLTIENPSNFQDFVNA